MTKKVNLYRQRVFQNQLEIAQLAYVSKHLKNKPSTFSTTDIAQ